MSGYKSFAVAGGTGGLGAIIVAELASSPQVEVTILSRSDKPSQTPGVRTQLVDYVSPSSLEEALKGVDVVISTLSGEGFGHQQALAEAAKGAGVKLFVPSEFGNDTSQAVKGSPHFKKKAAQLYCESIGLPYLLVYTGPFPDYVFVPVLGFNFVEGKATLVGKGNTPISFTARVDVARFLQHALLTFPPAKLANATLRLEGDRKTLNECLDIYSATHNHKSIDRTYSSVSETEKYIEDHPGMASFVQFLLLGWEKGETATVGKEEELSNKLWEEWNPKSVEHVFAQQA